MRAPARSEKNLARLLAGGWQTCPENLPSLHGPLAKGCLRTKSGPCGMALPRAWRHAVPTLLILAPISSSLRRGASGGGLSSSLVAAATHSNPAKAGACAALSGDGRATPDWRGVGALPARAAFSHSSPGGAA
jgi:hypothetical protein